MRTTGLLVALAGLAFAATAQAEEVRVTIPYYSAETQPYFEKVAADFAKQNPGLTVKIEIANWDNLLQKLTTDIAGGANADISIIGTRWLVDFVKQDVVEPLDSMMDKAFTDRFIGTFLSPSKLQGKTYGLPIAASARALYYNKELFQKAGVAGPPKTWDDAVAAAKKLSALPNTYGYGLQGKEIETDVYYYYALWTNGGDIVEGGKSGLHSDAALKAATFYKSLIDQKLTEPGVTAYNREDVQNLFKQGRVGMMITAPFLIGQIKKEAPSLSYGIAPIPSGGTNATYAVTDSIVMFKNSKVKPAAWKFLDFLFQPAQRIAFTKGEGFLPTTKAEGADPFFTGDANLQTFVSLLPNAKFAPTIANWEEIAAATIRGLQSIYTGQAEPKAALTAAAGEVDKLLQP